MAIDPAILRNALDDLTHELGRLLRNGGAYHAGSSGKPIAEPIEAVFEALRDGSGDADLQIERLIRAHPLLATAAAVAIGMSIGLLLRRG
jgi:hypothetical protein